LRSLPEAEYEDFSIGLADTAFKGLKITIRENVTKIKKTGPDGRNTRAHSIEATFTDEDGNLIHNPKDSKCKMAFDRTKMRITSEGENQLLFVEFKNYQDELW
jgi:hypothetical protein